MKAFFGTTFLVCFILSAAMAPAEYEQNQNAQRKAEAQMKARLFTKFPDPALAQMEVPAQRKKD
ncbi:hypothetical protein [Herbaspirillum robiniae]|uniref:hypothetical protein n=1 Tax=Herbaspirillum robiniae TaxID=2014887 RepID=UPI0009A234D7|nr:hypothetical protein [Herbaspirillum robiniae]